MARSLILPIKSFCTTIFPLVYAAKTVASGTIDIFHELSKIAPPPSPSPLLFPWRTPAPTPSLRLRPPPLDLHSSLRPPLSASSSSRTICSDCFIPNHIGSNFVLFDLCTNPAALRFDDLSSSTPTVSSFSSPP